MQPDKQDIRIESFWNWFQQMEMQYKGYFDDDPSVNKEFLVESMNNRVLDFGLFSWQMGPGDNKPFYFTISPNGNHQRMELSQTIIAAAPNLDGWEFYFAKPAKNWDFKLLLYDNFMRECHIDVALWQYIIVKKPNSKVDIFLDLKGADNVDQDTQLTAIDIAITNIIGEEKKILYVNKTEIFTPNSAIENVGPNSISELQQELNQHFNDCF